MASSALFTKLLCLGLLGMLAFAPHAEAAISCSQVRSSLSPCFAYIGGGALSPQCCSGIKSLVGKATTTPDRQAICGCLKSLAASIPGASSKAGQVVSACKVSIPYSLSPSTDCAKVK